MKSHKADLAVEWWAIAKPTPYARNPRRIPESAIAAVAGSLKEFGFRQPIVVDGEGVIIAGHTRLLAAQRLGMDRVPVHVAASLTPAQAKAYRLVDNRSSEFAEWDQELLGLELAEVPEMDLDFSDFGSMKFPEPPEPEGEPSDAEPQIDRAKELNKVWKVKAGDLWRIGEHRLLCGDSTKPEDVARVMGGEKSGAFVFDPPFNADEIIESFIFPDCKDAFVFGDAQTDTARRCNCSLPWQYSFIWDGVTRWIVPSWPVLAHKTCDWFSGERKYNHDGARDGREKQEGHLWKNARGETYIEADPRGKALQSVFRSPITSEGHGAEHSKPVLWLSMIIANCSEGIVFDAFCGSGSIIMACENTKRQCRAIEINPNYCAVILDRAKQAFPGLLISKLK